MNGTNHMRGTRAQMTRLFACACVAASVLVSAPAHAQQAQIDPVLITAMTLDGAQQQQVRDFAAPLAQGLRSKDQKQIQAARAAILEPMGNAQVSVQFRQEMTRALIDTLREVIGEEAGNSSQASSIGAINATIVAGELATEQASTLLTDALKSGKADMRYQAAMGIRRTFEAMQTTAPAVGDDRAQSMMRDVDRRIKEETDPLVLDALVRAGLAAAELGDAFRDVRSRGIEVVSLGAGAQIKRLQANPLDAATADAMLRAGTGVRDALANRPANVPVNQLAAKAVAELGGHMIAHAAKVVEARRLRDDPELRERYAQLSQLGETLVLTSAQALNSSQVVGKGLGPTLRQSTTQTDAKFALDARELTESLTRPPFDLPRDAFFQK